MKAGEQGTGNVGLTVERPPVINPNAMDVRNSIGSPLDRRSPFPVPRSLFPAL